MPATATPAQTGRKAIAGMPTSNNTRDGSNSREANNIENIRN
jgi:hypothetical protein